MEDLNTVLPHSDKGILSAAKLSLMTLLACFYFASSTSVFTATTILSETFEGNFPEDNGWTVADWDSAGTPAYWGKVDAGFGGEGTHGGAYKGYCAGYGYAGTYDHPQYVGRMSALMSKTLNLSNCNTAVLTWWYKIPSGKSLTVTFDDGSGTYCGPVPTWIQERVDLKRWTGGSVTITFWFGSDYATNGYEGVYLDDICVTADYLTNAPGAVKLTWPSEGTIMYRNFAYHWQDDLANGPASWYRLYVMRNGQKVLDYWTTLTNYTFELADPSKHPGGDYTWWVQPWNQWGLGPWSKPGYFTIYTNTPSVPKLLSPTNGSLASPIVNYQCDGYLDAAWCELCIFRNGAPYSDKWYNSCDIVLPGHATGQYTWWMRGWNADGMGPWSAPANYKVSLQVPRQMVLRSPSGKLSPADKTFYWAKDTNVDWFCLKINSNNTNYLTQWIQNQDQTSYTLSNPLPAGTYDWCMAGWNTEGMGPWATNYTFTVIPAGTPFTPVGTNFVSTNRCYEWFVDGQSSWYELCINKDGAPFYDQWFSTNSLSSGYNTSTICLTNAHPLGNYNWSVRPWNPVTGLGAWSPTGHFTLIPRSLLQEP